MSHIIHQPDFFRLPLSLAEWLLRHTSASVHQITLTLLREAYVQQTAPFVTASPDIMAARTGLNRRTAYAALAVLERAGNLRRVHQRADTYILTALGLPPTSMEA